MKLIKRVSKMVVLLLCTVFLFICVNDTLAFKSSDGVTPIKDFYHYPKDSIDVLLLGTSHMGTDIDAATLYDEYGIASYCLWGSMQPLWNSYFYLKEALKTQTPRLVILETYAAGYENEFSDYSRIVKNVSGMKLSQNKIEAIKVSAPEDLWDDLILQLPVSHTRYDELTETDFRYYPWSAEDLVNKHTHSACDDIFPCKRPDLENVTESKAILPKNEEYLIKIIRLLQEKQIPLLFICSPCPISQEAQMKQLRVQEIAEENGVPFVDYNQMYDEIELDFQSDFRDKVHLNYNGNQKVTLHLGRYLTDHFDLPDRRGNEDYKSWQEFAQWTWSMHLRNIGQVDGSAK